MGEYMGKKKQQKKWHNSSNEFAFVFSNYTQNGIFMVKTTTSTWIVLVPPKNFKNVTNCTTNPLKFDREKIL